MAPPFILNPKVTYPKHKNAESALEAEKIYSEKTFIHDWQKYQQSLPHDNNPYDQEHPDYNLSHYNTLGCDRTKYTTTTGDMLNQLHLKSEFVDWNPKKKLTSYCSFKSDVCKQEEPNIFHKMSSPYTTETQRSFVPPKPYKMLPLKLPEVPWLSTRKFITDKPTGKFLDDNIGQNIRQLQCHKGHYYNSYNFCTGRYTNGTVPLDGKIQKLTVPEYERVETK